MSDESDPIEAEDDTENIGVGARLIDFEIADEPVRPSAVL